MPTALFYTQTHTFMKDEETRLDQPSDESQKLYLDMIGNGETEVKIIRSNKSYKIRWLKNGQLEKLSRLLMHKDEEDGKTTGIDVLDEILADCKLACKAAAIIILDGYWKLKFNYWWMWRWFYYIKQYDNIQLQPILDEGKKKIPQMQFFKTIISLTGAKTTLMTMREKEAASILQELGTAQPSQTGSSSNG